MDQIRRRLESDLDQTMKRIRHSSGTVVIEESGQLPDGGFLADDGDVICGNAEREMCFATRSLLVERARKLGRALERLQDGEYGICEECGKRIAPARLQAMPEVTLCVHCQDRQERSDRFGPVVVGVGRVKDSSES